MIDKPSGGTGRAAAAVVLSAFAFSACATGPNEKPGGEPAPADWKPDSAAYRSYYGWDDTDGAWTLGTARIPSGTEVAYHVFGGNSEPPRGTLFVVHGYLEHASLRAPLVREAVRDGWTAVGIDLPGHGLSGGARADIGDFSEYADALEAVVAARPWPRPYRVLAHSLGTATVMLSMQRSGNPFELAILEAPLVRTFLWKPSVVAARLLAETLPELPRRNTGLRKDGEFYRTLVSDPLYMEKVPTRWFRALERYVAATEKWTAFKGRFLILQGSNDSVVDARYNVPFLLGLMDGAEVATIKGGEHHLLREEAPAGEEARRIVREAWSALDQ